VCATLESDASSDPTQLCSLSGVTSFTSNSADIAGGGYYFNMYPVVVTTATITFTTNTAPYGPDKAAYAISMQQITDPDSSLWSSYVTSYNTTNSISSLRRAL
jgi:hypothetical protein